MPSREGTLSSNASTPDGSERMPPPKIFPKGLTAAEKATLTRWIAEGAAYEKHWSFVPPKSPPLPAGPETNPIDRFVSRPT